MRTPRAEPRHAVFFAVVAASVTGVLLATGGHDAEPASSPVPVASAASWRGLVGSRPHATADTRFIVVLKTPSLAQRVADAGGAVDIEREQAWTKLAVAAQKLLVARLALNGVVVHPDYSFARVLDGFSAELPASAIPVVERDPDVAGVYPVRIAYPASTTAAPASDVDRALAHGGIDGRGVTIALVDTGVNAHAPLLRGHVLPGIDIVGGDPGARPAANPSDASRLEQHGTEMAGLLAGADGVAPAAAVLPIRVAGWQPDSLGGWEVYARTDQIVAGLDRAVDPNGDGDAHDAVRIALVALSAPFASFADGPESRAVAGARSLDTLVVAPAGNDGSAGAAYGDISAPGGAPDALTVGALDARRSVARVRVVARSELATLFDTTVPLAGASAPSRTVDLEVAAPRRGGGGSQLTRFFTRRGGSIVAGRAALVAVGASPVPAAESAAEAGASLVLLYGGRAPLAAGGLALDGTLTVPAMSLSRREAHAILARLAAGERVSVTVGSSGDAANGGGGHVAAFSSSGLAFDGSVKPDLVAPGVGLPTSGAGGDAVAVTGSSAAAAAVAGSAALLAQARPSLAADALAGLLVATAQPVKGDPVTAQGAGVVDAGAAVAGEAAASPATLALGTSTAPGRRVQAAFTLTNLSTRELVVTLGIRTQDEGAAAVDFALRPWHVSLRRGGSVLVHVTATTASEAVGTGTADGAVVGSIEGGGTIRVPWALAFGSPDVELIRSASLSARSFPRSDRRPALLSVDAGGIREVAGSIELSPLARLDVELAGADGTTVGLLARLRDVLPGRYTFGLTGRGPTGAPLPPGRYVVTLLAYPVDGGSPSRRKLGFVLR
jgi:Subtilase family